MSGRVHLKLLPPERYVGVDRHDPIRFYHWPVLGGLYRRRVEMCLEECPGGERVLEVGFGSGVSFPTLAQRYTEIHGLDRSARVDEVREMYAGEGLNLFLRNGDLLDMPFADESFDTVLLISILEHLKPAELERGFSEIRRVVRRGGHVVFGVPVERPLMCFVFRLMGLNIREHHFSTEREVRDAAARALGPVRVRTLRGFLGLAGAVYEVGHCVRGQES